jgi:phosphatidylserine/phosphatidylglycerophosphate/cardiolipin synthase-like enzyme
VRQDGNPRTFHHKVFLIDDEIVITGSLNFSENADDSNDENVVIVANGDIAAQYLGEFERRWAEAEEPDRADMNCE